MAQESFTNGQLLGFQEPLKVLMQVNVPARLGIRIARLVRTLRQEIALITGVRDKLIIQYGEKGSIGPDSPNWVTFIREHNDLLAQTVTLEVEKVTLPADASVDIATLLALEPFLTVEDMPSPGRNGVEKEAPATIAKTK